MKSGKTRTEEKVGAMFENMMKARNTAVIDVAPKPEPVETKSAVVVEVAKPVVVSPKKAEKPSAPVAAAVVAESTVRHERRAGQGKRSDPNFMQTSVFIPKELHKNSSIALRIANETRSNTPKEDFSELLTRLLEDWYKKQNFYKPRD